MNSTQFLKNCKRFQPNLHEYDFSSFWISVFSNECIKWWRIMCININDFTNWKVLSCGLIFRVIGKKVYTCIIHFSLSENILSYKKQQKNKTTTTQTQKTPKKDTEKKLVMSTFYFLLFLMGCKNPYFTYKPWSKFN